MASNAERISRAEQARAFATSDLYQQVRADAETEIVERWKASPTLEEREACHAALRGLQSLDEQLLRLINDGEVAKRDDARGRA